MKGQGINKRSKTKSIVYLLLVLAIFSSLIAGTKLLSSISFGSDTQKLLVEANLDKYINYNVSDQDKGTLVQYNIKEKIEYGESYFPIKNSEVVAYLSQIDGKYPYAVKALTKSTQVTNGKSSQIQENYEYDAKTGKLILRANNQNEQGEVIYQKQPSQNQADEYVILCYYDTYSEEKPERELKLELSATAQLAAKEEISINDHKNFDVKVIEPIGDITSLNNQVEDLYNGYIKSNRINGTTYQTTYKENQEIVVSKKEAQQKLKITENDTFVKISQASNGDINQINLGNNQNLVYKSTKIAKENIEKLLGEDGVLEILDEEGNQIASINKDTQYDEDGTITINDQDKTQITIKTSQIKQEGILYLEHTKEIKETMTDTPNIKIVTVNEISGINEEVTDSKTNEKQVYTTRNEKMIDIKEAQTNTNITVNNAEWTNKQQNEINFNVSLNASTIKDNLFKNPTIRIELPSQVEKVILQNSSIFYANGLELTDTYTEVNEEGKIVMVANLAGMQTAYHENALELSTDIKITATVILKKDIETTKANANVTITNEYTVDGSRETTNEELALKLENYQEEERQPAIEQEKPTFYTARTNQEANIDGLKLEVSPKRGEGELSNEDVIYAGEYIKYNIKVTNTSSEPMENVKVVGSIPEGTVYAELHADYDNSLGEYAYAFDDTVTTKEIAIGSIQAGQTKETYYEVRVKDLPEGQNEKEIDSNIQANIGTTNVAVYEMSNLAKPAEAKVFLGSAPGYDKNQWVYIASVSSAENKEVSLDLKAPKEFKLDYICLKGGEKFKLDEIAKVSEENVITIKLQTNQEYVVGGYIKCLETTPETENSEIELMATASVKVNDGTYQSNENRILYTYESVSISMTSDNEGEELKYGDEVNYEITATAKGKNTSVLPGYSSIQVDITDFLPEELEPISITYNNWEEIKENEKEDGSYTPTGRFNQQDFITKNLSIRKNEKGDRLADVDLILCIPYGESVTIKVKAKVGFVYEKTTIENSATIAKHFYKSNSETLAQRQATTTDLKARTSNIVTHTILPSVNKEDIQPENPNNPTTPGTPSNPSDSANSATQGGQATSNNSNTATEKYSIAGRTWLDENEDGKRQASEKTLGGITVNLVDQKDDSNIKGTMQTNADGTYQFTNLEKGNYVVIFRYDTNTYRVTEFQKNGVSATSNSDAVTKDITLNGDKIKVGLIDVSNLNSSVANMDMGLVENKVCDFKLDKSISKVTVTTKNGTKQYNYDNQKLAKIEIKAKEIEGATVVIEYKIVVTNEGELPATVGKVIDYLPEGLTFSSELNKNWSAQTNGQLINTSMANKKIEAGQSVELTLIATKKMTESSTGTFTNAAEIGDITNSLNIADKDSTPANKVKTEDDYSEAEVILSVSTGIVVYLSVTIIGALLIGITVFLIKKYGKSKVGKISLLVLLFVTMLIPQNINAETVKGGYYFTWTCPGLNEQGRCEHACSIFVGGPTGLAYCVTPGALGGYPSNFTVERWWFDNETTNEDRQESREIEHEADLTINMDKITNEIHMKGIDNYSSYLYGPIEFYCDYGSSGEATGYSLDVKDANGNAIAYEICDRNGNVNENLLSGTGNIEFYLKISADNCKKGISKIEVATGKTDRSYGAVKIFGYAYYRESENTSLQNVKTSDKVLFEDESYYWDELYETSKSIAWVPEPGGDEIHGSLDIIKQDKDQPDKKLAGVEIQIEGPSGTRTGKTDENGLVHFDDLKIGNYHISEIENPNYIYDETIQADVTINSGALLTYTLENSKNTGNLIITKKQDQASEKPLHKMGFKIKSLDGNPDGEHKQEYIRAQLTNSNEGVYYIENLSYTSNPKEATEFFTDSKGRLEIYNLFIGTYEVEETSTGEEIYYGYEIDPDYITWNVETSNGHYEKHKGTSATVEIEKTQSYNTEPGKQQGNPEDFSKKIKITNEKKYIKLSGYVWLDNYDGKVSQSNNKFNETTEELPDRNDLLFNGISVRLKDKTTGEVVKETKTSNLGLYKDVGNNGNGEYLFEEVLVRKLADYYIEFEYDGLTFTNVKAFQGDINKNNTSKAAESEEDRKIFNENFSVIEGMDKNTGITKDSKGNKKHDLTYTINNTDHIATLNSQGSYKKEEGVATQEKIGAYTITANTEEKQYSIKDHYDYKPETSEIRFINLGLYEREQPDMAIQKDLQKVRLTINGYEHTYTYAQRFRNEGAYSGDGFNVGVKYGEKYGGDKSYSRPVYKSDYDYVNEKDPSKNLKVYITYELKMGNLSDTLTTQINSLLEYYDSRYTIVDVGTKMEKSGKVSGHIDYDNQKTSSYEGYNKAIIKNNTKIEAKGVQSVYIEFELSQDLVKDIINEKQDPLNNVVEINSYSIFDGDNIYAGVDKDSNPANCVPGEKIGEDDSDRSPALKLETADARQMSGKVFLDKTGELRVGEIREGSGAYEEGEVGIKGVTVTLTETSGSGIKPISTETDEKGDFNFTNFVPGNYRLTYTWGDDTYTVQDYKGTIYLNKERQNDSRWWHEGSLQGATRLSDAIDNYSTDQEAPKGSRLQIDAQIPTVDTANKEEPTRKKMDSTTPIMGISVEFETTTTASTGDKYTYAIKNLDFGIVERARQKLDIIKRVKGIKLTLANGQVIVDAQIDENGQVSGVLQGLTYGPPTSSMKDYGFVRIEIDDELVQNATLQVEYAIKVQNNGEKDYNSEEYYKYGKQFAKDEDLIKMTAKIYDYLDNGMTLDPTKESDWTEIDRQTYDQDQKVEEQQTQTAMEYYYNWYDEEGNYHRKTTWEQNTSHYEKLIKEWETKVTEQRTIRDVKLQDTRIMQYKEEITLEPGGEQEIPFYASKLLANADEIELTNDAEMTEIRRTLKTGNQTQTITGRIPHIYTSDIYSRGEIILVTEPTGQNQNHIILIITTVTSLVILGAGIIIIKKKILKNNS